MREGSPASTTMSQMDLISSLTPSHPHSLTPSLTHSITPTLPHSLTLSFPLSRTHSLTHILSLPLSLCRGHPALSLHLCLGFGVRGSGFGVRNLGFGGWGSGFREGEGGGWALVSGVRSSQARVHDPPAACRGDFFLHSRIMRLNTVARDCLTILKEVVEVGAVN